MKDMMLSIEARNDGVRLPFEDRLQLHDKPFSSSQDPSNPNVRHEAKARNASRYAQTQSCQFNDASISFVPHWLGTLEQWRVKSKCRQIILYRSPQYRFRAHMQPRCLLLESAKYQI